MSRWRTGPDLPARPVAIPWMTITSQAVRSVANIFVSIVPDPAGAVTRSVAATAQSTAPIAIPRPVPIVVSFAKVATTSFVRNALMKNTAENAGKPVKKKRKKFHKRSQIKRNAIPTLRFSPFSWAKLVYFRDRGSTEVGAFGISRQNEAVPIVEDETEREESLEEQLPSKLDWNRLLCLDDIVFVKQRTTCVSVEFDDEAVADFYEDQVDAGREPFEFSRIWIHTHPGESAEPSLTDEETFARCFGNCDWSLMFILAEEGEFYARLQLRGDVSVAFPIPVEIDYGCEFRGSDREEWDREYRENVEPHLEWYEFDETDFGQMTSEEQEFLGAYYDEFESYREEIIAYEL